MTPPTADPEVRARLQQILGYLNFSTGAADARFAANVNSLYATLGGDPSGSPWAELALWLTDELRQLQASSPAFSDSRQAETVLHLTLEEFLPSYRRHHRDLLAHQPDSGLWRPFFLVHAFQAVLSAGSPFDETQRVIGHALSRINDFIGYRPVAVLRTAQKIEPYAHEWVAPIAIYLRGVGAAAGPYRNLVEAGMNLLDETDPELLSRSGLDPSLLDELAIDPRAYDFDHPVNKRPNYQFGQWDPHRLDTSGRFRRFVLVQTTLDAILERTVRDDSIPADQRLFEGAAVLAGIMLMAAAITGPAPGAHDSTTSLGNLVARIALDRDRFYERLIERVKGPHGRRLKAEAAARKQPFAAARQELNQRLARLRAAQLQHVHLARLFARMGHPEASRRQVEVVPVCSARMECQMACLMTEAGRELDAGRLEEVGGRILPEVLDVLHRAIECGAFADPWNVLGFQAHFSLFPAVENSIRDHRLDDLVRMVRDVFALHARLASEAAAVGKGEQRRSALAAMRRLAEWWDRFATTAVSGIEGFSGQEARQSAEDVSAALDSWRRAGTSAGDIAFWRQHVERFASSKAYAMAIEGVLLKGDFVASMGLIMQWLSHAPTVALTDGEYGLFELAQKWLRRLHVPRVKGNRTVDESTAWKLTLKFFDFWEANAGVFGEVPAFEWAAGRGGREGPEASEEDSTPAIEEFAQSAYENMVYRDSTDDGVEGSMLESGPATDFELDEEFRRLRPRLLALESLARMWRFVAALSSVSRVLADGTLSASVSAGLEAWADRGWALRTGLERLLVDVRDYRLPPPDPGQEGMIEYDRRRAVKHSLLESIVLAVVETGNAARLLSAALPAAFDARRKEWPDWDQQMITVFRALMTRDLADLDEHLATLWKRLEERPLLYVALERAGDPRAMAEAQGIQHALKELARGLGRAGRLRELGELIETARTMEARHPVGPGGVTEFDRLFAAVYRAMAECLVESSRNWGDVDDEDPTHSMLYVSLRRTSELLMKRWLSHARSVRLSVLERISNEAHWMRIRQFIEKYGNDLFTQQFLNPGNLRAILHQGAEAYLKRMADEAEPDERFELLDHLDGKVPASEAGRHLELVLEAVLENYGEYLDYNTTTTQSDRGELLYTLLDFLRLKASYDRVAWNLRPLSIAHEILHRAGRTSIGQCWRQTVAQKSSEAANRFLAELSVLQERYGMQLRTIADRLEERFVRSMAVDRMRALIPPALSTLDGRESSGPFDELESEIREFAEQPVGVGLDVPAWLTALENEVDRVQSETRAPEDNGSLACLPQVRLTAEDVDELVRTWPE